MTKEELKLAAKQIADGRRWSTKDWPEWMGYSDSLPLPQQVLEELRNGDTYSTLSDLDRCLWKYNLAIRNVDGAPMQATCGPNMFESIGGWRTFVVDDESNPYIYLGLANKIL